MYLFLKLYLISIEYKIFIYKKYLYILLGDSNYYKIKIIKGLNIICKKKSIYIYSFNNKFIYYNFINILLNLKNINIYKGKGLIRFPNFNFIKLKKGKKQQFM